MGTTNNYGHYLEIFWRWIEWRGQRKSDRSMRKLCPPPLLTNLPPQTGSNQYQTACSPARTGRPALRLPALWSHLPFTRVKSFHGLERATH